MEFDAKKIFIVEPSSRPFGEKKESFSLLNIGSMNYNSINIAIFL